MAILFARDARAFTFERVDLGSAGIVPDDPDSGEREERPVAVKREPDQSEGARFRVSP
ncbi:hypothetical protein [Acidiphilium iwatense]|uniref:Uncharacterized protein n=1 Tax=Acidiphilium iwatense TaxID=768198 RepID=A0ABS9E1G9_9PROT|nr:hypothetical protein [Acidiphilium iwatense]MCF3948847.1 hypothetical protein [Acidiphilium iwatense]